MLNALSKEVSKSNKERTTIMKESEVGIKFHLMRINSGLTITEHKLIIHDCKTSNLKDGSTIRHWWLSRQGFWDCWGGSVIPGAELALDWKNGREEATDCTIY